MTVHDAKNSTLLLGLVIVFQRVLPVVVAVVCILIWGLFMVISQAFVVYSQPLPAHGGEVFFIVFLKWYPLISLAVLAIGIFFSDRLGLLPWMASLTPPLLMALMVSNMFRGQAVSWDVYGTAQEHAFMKASAFGSAADVRELVAAGVDPNLSGKEGNTPLLAAYKADNLETFAVLLSLGADPNLLPMGSAKYNAAFQIVRGHSAAPRRLSYFELLMQNGLDVNLGDGHERLIHAAAVTADPVYLDRLIREGADTRARHGSGHSPMGMATLHRRFGNAMRLVAHSEDEDLRDAASMLKDGGDRGYTPENIAMRDELIKQLKARGIAFSEELSSSESRHETLSQWSATAMKFSPG